MQRQPLRSQRGTSEGYTLVLVVVVAALWAAGVTIQNWIKDTKDERIENRTKPKPGRKADTRGVWD